MPRTATASLNKYARTVGVSGEVAMGPGGYALVDGQRRTPLGNTKKEAERRLGCLGDPHKCWAVPEGTYGRPVTRLGNFAVGDRVRVIQDADDGQGNFAAQGSTGTITQILDKSDYPYFVEIEGEEEYTTGLWLGDDEIK